MKLKYIWCGKFDHQLVNYLGKLTPSKYPSANGRRNFALDGHDCHSWYKCCIRNYNSIHQIIKVCE